MPQSDPAMIAKVNAVDRELARCLDLLGHIRDSGFYPPSGDTEALAELNEHIASGDRARDILRSENDG